MAKVRLGETSLFASVDIADNRERNNFINMMRTFHIQPEYKGGTVVTIRVVGPRDKVMEVANICYDYPAHTVNIGHGRL